MFRISKKFSFSASHCLSTLAADHPCARLHGHNYVVEVELASEALNQDGFVRDYRELSMLKDYIDERFDHRHLNDVLGHDRTTAEMLAKHFYEWCADRFPETVAVRIRETPNSCAEYRPDNRSNGTNEHHG